MRSRCLSNCVFPFFLCSVSFHFPDENLVFAKINCKQNLEHSAESCLHKTMRNENLKEGPEENIFKKKWKKTQREKENGRERRRERERIKLCRWDFCAVLMHFVYCILVCMARTSAPYNYHGHIKIAAEFSFSQFEFLFSFFLSNFHLVFFARLFRLFHSYWLRVTSKNS